MSALSVGRRRWYRLRNRLFPPILQTIFGGHVEWTDAMDDPPKTYDGITEAQSLQMSINVMEFAARLFSEYAEHHRKKDVEKHPTSWQKAIADTAAAGVLYDEINRLRERKQRLDRR